MSILSAGTSNTTSLIYTGDTTGAMVFQTNGTTEAMRITAAQNVGIGTTAPSFLTEIVGGATTVETTLLQIRSNAGGINTGTTIALGNSTNPTAGSGRVELAALRNTASGGSFVIRTGDDSGNIQERMRIDSSGRVTMPYQPAFHVRVNDANYITTSPVPFTNVVFDVGSNFNTSTYRFTAPIAGKYYIVLNMYLATTQNKDAYPRFNINGSAVQYSYLYQTAGGTIHNTVSLNRIFNLSVGDYVTVTFNGNGEYYGGNQETNFYGYLIG